MKREKISHLLGDNSKILLLSKIQRKFLFIIFTNIFVKVFYWKYYKIFFSEASTLNKINSRVSSSIFITIQVKLLVKKSKNKARDTKNIG